MNIVAFSDLHAHPFRQFANYQSGTNSRLLATLARLSDVLRYATSEQPCDAILFAGDFFHERAKLDVLAAVEVSGIFGRFLGGSTQPFIAVSGTHDMPADGVSPLKIYEGARASGARIHVDGIFEVVDREFSTWTIYCIPDTGKEKHEAVVRQALRHNHDRESSILLTHGTVLDSRVELSEWQKDGLNPRFLYDHFALSIVGHFHKPVLLPEFNILVPGAVIPHGFGDDCGAGSLWSVALSFKKAPSFKQIEFKHPAFLTIDTDVVGDSIPDFAKRSFYRLLTSDPEWPAKSQYAGFSNVVFSIKPLDVAVVNEDSRIPIRAYSDASDVVQAYADYMVTDGQFPSSLRNDAGLRLVKKVAVVLVRSEQKDLGPEELEEIDRIFDEGAPDG